MDMKKRLVRVLIMLSGLAMGGLFSMAATAQEPPTIADPFAASRFSLGGLEVTDYKKVAIRIELYETHESGKRIGLTKEKIRNECELRLRQAGLQPTEEVRDEFLFISMTLLGGRASAFSINVSFVRPALFMMGEKGETKYLLRPDAVSWLRGTVGTAGTAGGDPGFVTQQLDGLLDKFLNEYLKDNSKF